MGSHDGVKHGWRQHNSPVNRGGGDRDEDKVTAILFGGNTEYKGGWAG